MKYDGREINKEERQKIDAELRRHPLTRKIMTGAIAAGEGSGAGGLVYVRLGGVFIKAVFPHNRAGVHEGRVALALSLHQTSRSIVPPVYDVFGLPEDSGPYIDHVIVMGQAPGKPLGRHEDRHHPEVLGPIARAFARLHSALDELQRDHPDLLQHAPLSLFNPSIIGEAIGHLLVNPDRYWTSPYFHAKGADRVDDGIEKLSRVFCAYGQTVRTRAGIHGDPHTGNILFDRDTGTPTLIDFARIRLGARESDVRVDDLTGLQHFVDEYNAESKQPINPNVITTMAILSLACKIYEGDEHPFHHEEACHHLLQRLEDPGRFYGPYVPLGL
jgi:hypothetical protein